MEVSSNSSQPPPAVVLVSKSMEAKIRQPKEVAKMKLHLALVLAQALFAGFEVLSRVALNQGVGLTAFTFYRNCIATILLGIYGVVLERKKWTHLSYGKLCYMFFLGFLGVTLNQLCYLVGLSLTSVMFASAIRNSIPIITFTLACIFRLENVDIKQLHGRAKVAGALIGFAGALVISLFQGSVILASKFAIFHPKPNSTRTLSNVQVEHIIHFFTVQIHFKMVSWQLGAIFLVLSGASFAAFLILQVPILKSFRAPISFASISCFSSVIQLPLLAAAFEPNWSLWRNISLGETLSILYAGVIGSGIVSGVQSWAVHGGGPVIVASYQPLETLITACFSFFFLKEDLHLGTLVGGITIIAGLYLLVWGQRQEMKCYTKESMNLSSYQIDDNEKFGSFNSLMLGSSFVPARISTQKVVDESLMEV